MGSCASASVTPAVVVASTAPPTPWDVEYVCVDFAAAHPILRTVRPAMELALPKVATVGCLRLLLGRETSVVLGCESGELLEDATMLRTLPGVRIELPNSARIKVRFRGCAKAAAASLAAKPHSALTTAPFELSDFDAFCARFSQQAVAYLADPVLQFHLALALNYAASLAPFALAVDAKKPLPACGHSLQVRMGDTAEFFEELSALGFEAREGRLRLHTLSQLKLLIGKLHHAQELFAHGRANWHPSFAPADCWVAPAASAHAADHARELTALGGNHSSRSAAAAAAAVPHPCDREHSLSALPFPGVGISPGGATTATTTASSTASQSPGSLQQALHTRLFTIVVHDSKESYFWAKTDLALDEFAQAVVVAEDAGAESKQQSSALRASAVSATDVEYIVPVAAEDSSLPVQTGAAASVAALPGMLHVETG